MAILANPSISQAEALTKHGGYAASTAATPKANGVNAGQCVAEAIKLNPEVNPATLLEKARLLSETKIDSVLADPEAIKKARLGEVARMAEVMEKWHGDRSETQEMTPASFLERAKWVAELDRLIKASQPQHLVVEAESVESESV